MNRWILWGMLLLPYFSGCASEPKRPTDCAECAAGAPCLEPVCRDCRPDVAAKCGKCGVETKVGSLCGKCGVCPKCCTCEGCPQCSALCPGCGTEVKTVPPCATCSKCTKCCTCPK